jgi:DNA-binding PucR family transcriptional regulator
MASDAGAGTDYVATLRAWLEQAGDVGRAAAQLHVHPNTLRYRLRRMAAVAPLELDSPSARLALQLQLAAVAR